MQRIATYAECLVHYLADRYVGVFAHTSVNMPDCSNTTSAPVEITPKQLRQLIPKEFHETRWLLAIGIFLFDVTLWCVSLCLLSVSELWATKNLWCFVNGCTVAHLFLLGHETCHQHYSGNRTLDRILGRICLVPSLHGFSQWHVVHNQIHHNFTNLRTRDCVWVPLDKSEYDALSPPKKLLYRAYRSWFGAGIYWTIDIWYKKLIRFNAKKKTWSYYFDDVLIAAFAVAMLLGLPRLGPFLAARIGGTAMPTVQSLIYGFFVPIFIAHWLVGLSTYVQHTGQDVAWFSGENEWNFFRAQVENSVHIEYLPPSPINWLMCGHMSHTAHHIDPTIPVYHLRECQSHLETLMPGHIVHRPFKLKNYRQILKACKLYDYDTHRWTDYAGSPTTEQTVDLDAHVVLPTFEPPIKTVPSPSAHRHEIPAPHVSTNRDQRVR